MIKKYPILVLFFLIIFSLFVNADYSEIGYDDGKTYNLDGVGFFNENLDFESDNIYSSVLQDSSFMPLISDLDNDGTKEIIVYDDRVLKIYQNKELDYITGFALPSLYELSGYEYNFEISQLENDTEKEIFVYPTSTTDPATSNKVHLLKFNGTHLYNVTSWTLDPLSCDSYMDGACDDEEKNCFIFSACVSGSDKTTGYAFNLTHSKSTPSGFVDTTHSINYFPFIKNIAISDLKNTGKNQYIMTLASRFASSPYNRVVEIYTINVAQNLSSYEYFTRYTKSLYSLNSGNTGAHFTSALPLDFDGVSANGKELVFGMALSSDTYKMYSVKQSGTTWVSMDDYPEIFTSDGILMSNPILANIFDDSGLNDVCVFGQKPEDKTINVICSSEETSSIPETREFDYDVSYNLSYSKYLLTSHAVQHKSDYIDDVNPSEFLTPYGIFEIDYAGINHLNLIWEAPTENIKLIQDDYEGFGRNDIIGMTTSNLFYYDDGYTKSGGQITNEYYDPCYDNTIQVNETLTIKVKVEDIDGDKVSAKAVIYEGTIYEQSSNWTANYTSGTTFPFYFILNQTIPSSTISIYGRDTSNPTDIDSISHFFSVNNVGVLAGIGLYCENDIDLDVDDEDDIEDELDADEDDNIVVNNLRNVDETFNLNLGLTTLWIIIICVVLIGIWLSAMDSKVSFNPALLIGFILLIFFILTIIGAKLGLISGGLIIVMVIIALIILGISFSGWFFGGKHEK